VAAEDAATDAAAEAADDVAADDPEPPHPVKQIESERTAADKTRAFFISLPSVIPHLF
jgi:hypothetical protein